MSPSIKEVWIEISCITFKNEWGKGILCPNFCIQFQPALYTFCTFIIFVIPFASLKAQTSYEKMLYLSTI